MKKKILIDFQICISAPLKEQDFNGFPQINIPPKFPESATDRLLNWMITTNVVK